MQVKNVYRNHRSCHNSFMWGMFHIMGCFWRMVQLKTLQCLIGKCSFNHFKTSKNITLTRLQVDWHLSPIFPGRSQEFMAVDRCTCACPAVKTSPPVFIWVPGHVSLTLFWNLARWFSIPCFHHIPSLQFGDIKSTRLEKRSDQFGVAVQVVSDHFGGFDPDARRDRLLMCAGCHQIAFKKINSRWVRPPCVQCASLRAEFKGNEGSRLDWPGIKQLCSLAQRAKAHF